MKSVLVSPIWKGYPKIISFDMSKDIEAEYNLMNCQFVADFKESKNSNTSIFRLDSDANSSIFSRSYITKNNKDYFHLEMNLSANNTALINKEKVLFQIITVLDNTPRPLQGIVTWPVKFPLTVV